jgi:hypothetical protein
MNNQTLKTLSTDSARVDQLTTDSQLEPRARHILSEVMLGLMMRGLQGGLISW